MHRPAPMPRPSTDPDLCTVTYAAPWVLCPGMPPLRDGAVSVDATGRVVAVGRARDFADVTVDHRAGVLMPGVVNAHTHLELSHMFVEGGDGLVPWIQRLLRTRTEPEPSAIQEAVAFLESRGTVAVGDVSNSGASLPALQASSLHYRVFLEQVAPRPQDPHPEPPHLDDACCTVTSHSTYATHEGVLRRAGAASIHVEEDPAEAQWLLSGEGPLAELLPPIEPARLRPVRYLDALGLLRPGTLLVHMTCAEEDDFDLAARRGAFVVLCPRSNQHITGRTPPWRRARAAGCSVALGTDSLASCPSLDVFAEMAVLAHDGAPPDWLIEAATTSGLRALGFGPPARWIEVGDSAATLSDPLGWVAHEAYAAPVRRVSWQ